MRRLLLLGCLIPFLLSCTNQEIETLVEDTFSIGSSFTSQNYEMTVLRPAFLDPTKFYPYVFLLDGHWHYNQVAKDMKRLIKNGEMEDVILVGIAYEGLNPNGLAGYGRISELRIDDFTSVKNNESDEWGGKSEAFRNFLGQELLPELRTRYAEDSNQRTLMGHSLGGYFGIWEMFTYADSSLFKNIHSGSPALWWADGSLMELEKSFADGTRTLDFNFHTTMGTMESVTWNTFFNEFEERVESRDYQGFTSTFERYPRGHAANAEPGFLEALKLFFSAN